MLTSTPLTRREFAGLTAKAAAGALALGTASAFGKPSGSKSPGPHRGIYKIIRHPKALEAPLDVPEGETWRYLLAYPFQVGPSVAAVYVNLKDCGFQGQDFECGNDIVLFDRIGG